MFRLQVYTSLRLIDPAQPFSSDKPGAPRAFLLWVFTELWALTPFFTRRNGTCKPFPVRSISKNALMGRRNEFLRQRAAFAFAEEEAVHLLHQKVLRLPRPGL